MVTNPTSLLDLKEHTNGLLSIQPPTMSMRADHNLVQSSLHIHKPSQSAAIPLIRDRRSALSMLLWIWVAGLLYMSELNNTP